MYCKKCNVEYSGDQKFCGVCGEKLSEVHEEIKKEDIVVKEDLQEEEKSVDNSKKEKIFNIVKIVIVIGMILVLAMKCIDLVKTISGSLNDYKEYTTTNDFIGQDFTVIHVNDNASKKYFREALEDEDIMSELLINQVLGKFFFLADKEISECIEIVELGKVDEKHPILNGEYFYYKMDILDLETTTECIQRNTYGKWNTSTWQKDDEIYVLCWWNYNTKKEELTIYYSYRNWSEIERANTQNETTDYKSISEPKKIIVKDNDKVEKTEKISTDKIRVNVDGLYSYEIPKSWEDKYKTTIEITSYALSFYLEEDFRHNYGGLIGNIEVLPIDTEFPNDEEDPYYGIYWSAVDYLGIIETEKGTFHIISTVPREGGQCSPENEDLYYQMSEEFLSVVVPSITPLEGYEYEKNFRAN